jgi:hypothetical protein
VIVHAILCQELSKQRRQDLLSGAWASRHRDLLDFDWIDGGYWILVAE